jgi:hypothetical protein
MRIRSKTSTPQVLEAMQYTGNNTLEIYKWSEGMVTADGGRYFEVETVDGPAAGLHGDWIVMNEERDYFPVRQIDFGKLYEEDLTVVDVSFEPDNTPSQTPSI